MPAVAAFDRALTESEHQLIANLDTPNSIQHFLDDLTYSTEEIYRCPLRVLRERVGHCFDGALFAAAMLRRLGHPPSILDMLPNDRDDDHLLALFKRDDHWGAVAKSNFVGLRFREPIYRNLRELILSYFEQYYNVAREKTLRGYTRPLNLQAFDKQDWMTRDEPLEAIAQRLDEIPRFSLLTERMIAGLTLVDERSCQAGLIGANEAGLYKP
ncbi:MAG: hypothetical protein U1F76_31685 [Candidatus Competibacteraceae bacterium]